MKATELRSSPLATSMFHKINAIERSGLEDCLLVHEDGKQQRKVGDFDHRTVDFHVLPEGDKVS